MRTTNGTDTPSEAGWPRVVVVGAGFAGLAVADALKDARAEVTILDRQNCHVFQPLLYQVATAALAPAEVAMPIRQMFRGRDNVAMFMDEVVGVDRAGRRVLTRAGAYPYDCLVLATGSEYAYFGHDGWRDRTLSLKSLADAVAIRERVLSAFELAELAETEEERRRYLSFAVVGGGPTGVELAGALADLVRATLPTEYRRVDPRHARVYLFEALPTLLSGFDAASRDYARRALARKGVHVLLGTPVGDIVDGRVVAGEAAYEAGTVLWAAGVNAGCVGRWLDVACDRQGRVPVTPDLYLEDDNRVYVVGDAARVAGEDGEPLPALAAVAHQQGAYVGRSILRRLDGKAPEEPFRYLDRGMLATMGRSAAVAELGRARLRGRFAWVVWWLVHIYYLIGFRNRLVVFLNWLWSTFTNRTASRLITWQARAAGEPRPLEELSDAARRWRRRRSAETEAGLESFPASDPPAYTAGTAGAPRRGNGAERRRAR